jgi:hypothetical protein
MAKRKPAARHFLALEQISQSAHDGAVLPILHFNGYKIANPAVLARISHSELECLFRRLRLHAVSSSKVTTRNHASTHGRHARCGLADISAKSSALRVPAVSSQPTKLAHDHPALTQGLDRPERWLMA